MSKLITEDLINSALDEKRTFFSDNTDVVDFIIWEHYSAFDYIIFKHNKKWYSSNVFFPKNDCYGGMHSVVCASGPHVFITPVDLVYEKQKMTERQKKTFGKSAYPVANHWSKWACKSLGEDINLEMEHLHKMFEMFMDLDSEFTSSDHEWYVAIYDGRAHVKSSCSHTLAGLFSREKYGWSIGFNTAHYFKLEYLIEYPNGYMRVHLSHGGLTYVLMYNMETRALEAILPMLEGLVDYCHMADQGDVLRPVPKTFDGGYSFADYEEDKKISAAKGDLFGWKVVHKEKIGHTTTEDNKGGPVSEVVIKNVSEEDLYYKVVIAEFAEWEPQIQSYTVVEKQADGSFAVPKLLLPSD